MPFEKLMKYSEYFGMEAPFPDHLDVRCDPGQNGEFGMILDIQPMHTNAGKVLHGGMLMSMFDIAMGTMCRIQDPLGRSVVTVEMKVSFMRPGGRAGDRIRALGIVRHAARSLVFCDGELRGEAGILLATASGIFKYINNTAVPGAA